MNLMIGAALLPNIFFDHFLITVLTYRVGIISTRPEFPTPEFFLHFRVKPEDFFCGNALYDLHNSLWGKNRDALDKKMNMVFVSSDLNKMHLVSFTDTHTNFFEYIFHFFRKDLFSILCRTHHMIKEKGLVVPLKDMFTHPPILLQNDITMSRKDIPRSRAARNVLIQ